MVYLYSGQQQASVQWHHKAKNTRKDSVFGAVATSLSAKGDVFVEQPWFLSGSHCLCFPLGDGVNDFANVSVYVYCWSRSHVLR